MSREKGQVSLCVLVAGLSVFAIVSCRSTDHVNPDETRLDDGLTKANMRWQPKTYPPLRVAIPQVAGAEYVNEDRICHVCHKTHVESFQHNVHRQQGCESCHGPASRHLETRGKQSGLILNFKTMKRAERSEICAKCHQQDACAPGMEWRTSAHAHHGVACTDCHLKNHYNVPEGTPKMAAGNIALLDNVDNWKALVAKLRSSLPPDAIEVASNTTTLLATQLASKAESNSKSDMETREPNSTEKLPSLRGTSGFLGAIVPHVCYRCHSEKAELETVAHPHQINGQHGFSCTTCHSPHGNVLEHSRKELCLECHKGTPTQAWHSSVHDQVGVACTDCHNPHPNTRVQQLVNISHTTIRRPKRLPMSVNDPLVCYKCHPKIFGLNQLPSHHPIREGKMTCSDCHDPHGQAEGGLNESTVNLTCYKCHAEKQGPFVYEHPPVNEDCSICHNPHGAVANNLLHQPTTFLCLRCHAGHRASPTEHFGIGTSDIDGNPALRAIFYTDCTHCHSQVHGSDLPSQNRSGALLR